MTGGHDFVVEHGDGRLAVRGELDIATADRFMRSLAAIDGGVIEVNLAGLTFVDSVGLRTLLQARRDHTGLRFVEPARQLQRLADIAGVTEQLFAD